MAKQLIPLVKSGYLASPGYIPLVHGNGLTTNVEPEPQYETLTGDIVTFNSLRVQPLEALSCTIVPVQDLHGQSSPWPAGGGKNLLKPSAYGYDGVTNAYTRYGTLSVDGDTYNFSAQANSDSYFGNLAYSSPVPSTTYNAFIVVTVESNTLYSFNITNNAFNKNYIQFYDDSWNIVQASGRNQIEFLVNTGSFTSPAGATKMGMRIGLQTGGTAQTYSTKIQIAKESSPGVVSAWTPYANLCPISGWSEAKVTRTGANLFDYTSAALYKGFLQTSANISTWRSSSDSRTFVVKCLPNTAYRIEVAVAESTIFRVGDVDTLPVGTTDWGDITLGKVFSQSTTGVIDYTTSATANYLVIQGGRTAVDSGTFKQTLSVNYPATVTGYHAYTAQTVTIDLSGTRYGGTLDVKTGLLTITEESTELKNLPWDKSATANNPNGTYFYVNSTTVPYIGWATVDKTKCLCNALKPSDTGGVDNSPANSFWWNNASTGWRIIYGLPNGGSNVSDLTSFLTTNNVILVAPLATPISVQLSAHELSTLLGQNNIWSTTGQSTVTYQTN